MPRRKPTLIHILIVSVILFVLGKLIEHKFDHSYIHDADAYSIQQTIHEKQSELFIELSQFKEDSLWTKDNRWSTMNRLSESKNSIYLFEDSVPVAWSNHNVPIQSLFPDSASIIRLPNGWYLKHSVKTDLYHLTGISLIKEQYEYQNKFLLNEFTDEFSITHQPSIHIGNYVDQFTINDVNGTYLMSLDFDTHNFISPFSISALVLYCISFSLLILIIIRLHKRFNNKSFSNLLLIVSFLSISALGVFFVQTAIPYELSQYNLFSPLTFAVSDWLPSLGSLLVYSIFMLLFSFCFYRYFKAPKSVQTNYRFLYVVLLFAFVFTQFLVIDELIRLIVTNSSQASIFFNIEDLNSVTLFKVVITCLFYTSVLFVYERIIVTLKAYISLKELLISTTLSAIVLFVIAYLLGYTPKLTNIPVFIIIGLILLRANRNRSNGITYSSLMWVIFILSLNVLTLLYFYNIDKEERNRELIVENISFQLTREADPVAEMYLSEIENRITEDNKLIELLLSDVDNEKAITEYLEKNYFYGYWKRYDIEIVVCWENASVYLESEDITTDCYSYFDDLIVRQGALASSCNHFYFLDNDNGQTTYFGKLPYLKHDKDKETTLYIEINSTPIFAGLGYPELLRNQQEQYNLNLYKNYSFAKYIDNKLVKQQGQHTYPIHNSFQKVDVGEKVSIEKDDTVFLIYQLNEETTIILSRDKVKRIYLLMSFSTLALLFFIITALFLLVTRTHKAESKVNFTIQERIQIAFVSLMVVSLLIMGVSSVFYSIHQFKNKNNQMLSQRIKSVLQEMEQKIVNEEELNDSMHDYLQYLMQKFSNVFYSDINLYNLNGKLLATSRPELYQHGLSGRIMNTEAYYQLTVENQLEYIHDESIGKLHFTSAYVPIYNFEGNVLAYLNLPYFVGNNELKSEVSSLIVAVINAYLLFIIITIGLAVLLSRRITRPLSLIQDRLAQVRIDKMNKKIGYKGDDEIGRLVKEYNRMVDEISDSAEKLAKSEREMAWREMAKQIAHEIKNPLTPMKLSVQYMLKAWDSKKEGFDDYLKRVSNTLIEQIDQLHTIANEFSNFAKMPQAQRSKVDIIDKVQNVTNLFEKSEQSIHFTTQISDDELYIFADGDQMISVLNNVIKNAVQAIPNGRTGNINISVKKVDLNVLISVSDNGRGISKEIKQIIFSPNFTTKSSGMGLGLAIVKNIITNSGGEIWFETEENIGTTFYVQLPVYEGD